MTLRRRRATASTRCAGGRAPGDDYRFVLDGGGRCPTRARAGSRAGCAAPRGCSTRGALAGATGCAALALADLVLYELHVGTLQRAGHVRRRDRAPARRSRELGVTAIEMMPVAEFPGARGWGYDGVYISAAQSSLRRPARLAALVAAAHDAGLAVILDVVYNHLGASGVTAMEAFGPYFTDKYETPWGKAINYDDAECDPVREWVLQSAEGWVRDFAHRRAAARRDPRDLRRRAPEHIVAAIGRARARGPTRARS